MKIKYNDSENTIEIKDGLKNQYLILKILMILNLANALIRLIGQNKTEYGIIEYFWIAIGIVSLIALYFFLFKNSTAEKIKVGEIKRLNEKPVFGRKRFSLELDNGKKRILGNFKNEFELVEMRELFARVGISN
ncbi:hypothetical protein [Winogradskyella vidalii]|uniref:hypothetical protein n=1 Tax=Winogradskyella vidalii TaxID=2615024 RepID=UPI0015CABF7C|nr:hypothetical protein [Winogradskyella vidalii]